MAEVALAEKFCQVPKFQRISNFLDFPTLSSQGFAELTRTEIRKDLREIERSLLIDDSDSISSVKSEDIIVATYPVKPRKNARIPSRGNGSDGRLSASVTRATHVGGVDPRGFDQGNESANIVAADEALEFLRALRVSKRELYQAEVDRERMETQRLSYENSIEDKIQKFSIKKSEQENYLQLLQAIYAKYLRQGMLYSRQNSMLHEVMVSINRRRQVADILDQETKALKTILQSSGKSAKAKASATSHLLISDDTAVLRVHLAKSGKDVVLLRGQWLKTPMGVGQIESIRPQAKTVVIKLPFGLMYSCLNRAVCWGGLDDRHDISSDKALYHKWTTSKSVNIPLQQKLEIHSMLKGLNGTEQDEVSDNDDDDMSIDNEQEHPSTDDHQALRTLGKAFDTFETTTEGEGHETESATSMDLTLHNSLTKVNFTPAFPLPVSSGSNSRQEVRNKVLKDNILSPSVPLQALSLAFAPPSAIPSVIEHIQRNGNLEICPLALSSQGVDRLGTTGSLAWSGDIHDMEQSLKQAARDLSKLEKELEMLVKTAERDASRSMKVTKDITALRLAMFTKRLRHRNNLMAHGATATAAAASSASAKVKTEEKTDATSSSADSKAKAVDKDVKIEKDAAGAVPKKRTRDGSQPTSDAKKHVSKDLRSSPTDEAVALSSSGRRGSRSNASDAMLSQDTSNSNDGDEAEESETPETSAPAPAKKKKRVRRF